MTTLVATQLGNSASYQVGLGPSSAQAAPFDLYTGLGGTAAGTLTPLTSYIYLSGSSTITSATIQFPANAVEGQELTITSDATVTTLTCTAASATQNANGIADTIKDTATSLTAYTSVKWKYRLTQATNTVGPATASTNLYAWYRLV